MERKYLILLSAIKNEIIQYFNVTYPDMKSSYMRKKGGRKNGFR